MSQSPFLEMPLHLISLVLSELDSIESLGSAILSHSSMYAAFNEHFNTILFRILSNQIPSILMVYVANTYDATMEEFQSTQKLWNMSDRTSERWDLHADGYLRRELKDHKSGPALAASFSKTHVLVERFTDRFMSDTLPRATRDIFGRSPEDTIRPSDNELFRVRRAFYRFQFYCNIIRVRDNDSDSCGQQNERDRKFRGSIFFLHFPPWVNEQIACIHDYLEGILSKGGQLCTQRNVQALITNIRC